MNFIEVKKGISVRKSDIEAIIRSADGKCKVHTDSNQYESTMTYEAIRTLLNIEKTDPVIEKLNRIIQQQQIFVG